jgi:predicted alpha/beta hydrolase
VGRHFRGMGLSASRSVRKTDVDILAWARGDCAAMIDSLKTRLSNRPLFVVGHSLGGQIIAMIPNRKLIDGAIIIASGERSLARNASAISDSFANNSREVWGRSFRDGWSNV